MIKTKKFNGFHVRYKIWLEDSNNISILGDGKYRLLKTIHEEGSLMAAIEKMGLDYRRTWGNLKKIERLLGFPILYRQRGGNNGGSTVLTEEGKLLLHAYDDFHAKMDGILDKAFEEFQDKLNGK